MWDGGERLSRFASCRFCGSIVGDYSLDVPVVRLGWYPSRLFLLLRPFCGSGCSANSRDGILISDRPNRSARASTTKRARKRHQERCERSARWPPVFSLQWRRSFSWSPLPSLSSGSATRRAADAHLHLHEVCAALLTEGSHISTRRSHCYLSRRPHRVHSHRSLPSPHPGLDGRVVLCSTVAAEPMPPGRG